MQRTTVSLCFLLLAVGLWGQSSSDSQKVAIHRVKNLLVSSFDPLLPKVTLEFFLKSESEGAPIIWEFTDCGERTANSKVDITQDSLECVAADTEFQDHFKDLRRVTVIVSMGTFKRGAFGVPTLLSVTVTGHGGVRSIRRLSDLRMELHRPPAKLPRDLPFPVGALSCPIIGLAFKNRHYPY